MKIVIDFCSKCDCGNKSAIVNNTHYLCAKKNRERLDSRGTFRKKQKAIKKVSYKKKVKNLEKSNVYDEIAKEREHECVGCGTDKYLTHSHIIPVSQNESLETEKGNIVYHCMQCHTIWEHGSYLERSKLNNFLEAIEYMASVDTDYYNLFMSKWQREKEKKSI